MCSWPAPGKTYKSTAFQNGFSARRGLGASESGTMEVCGQRTLLSTFKSGRVSDLGSVRDKLFIYRDLLLAAASY